MPITSFLRIDTPLGSDLHVARMSAQEEMGRLFEINVDVLSEDAAIDPYDLLGKPVCVNMEVEGDSVRHFHGNVCRITQLGAAGRFNQYRLVLRPDLWLLTRRSDIRIFQEMSAPDIIKKVFDAHGMLAKFSLQGIYSNREYCVQYRETDFNFVSRLMEQEGIYYYFEHVADKHTMVLVDKVSAHEPCPGSSTFKFRESVAGNIDLEAISHWHFSREIQSGKVTLRDFDFKKPALNLTSENEASGAHAQPKLEIYDYPGEYLTPGDGRTHAKTRLDEIQSHHALAGGDTNVRHLATGYLFTLADHPRDDQNIEYLIISSDIHAQAEIPEAGADGVEPSYSCQFSALSTREVFRPLRTTPCPTVAGPQTAIVVGPSGSEIHTDEHGRVKVQFHWDRLGKKDEKSSCWIRVSHPWAGEGFGMIAIPRIGQEVVVDFLEGNPDQPLITGRVYHGTNVPPYALPANATVSTMKSQSSPGGDASNFNELRFEDKKGSEYIFLHAEKDFDRIVKNDSFHSVGHDEHVTITNDLKEKVGNDQHLEVGKDLKQKVGGDMHLETATDLMIKSGGQYSLKAAKDVAGEAGTGVSLKAGTDVHIKGGVNVTIEAGVTLTLKAGGSTIVLGPSGVSIVGTLVNINSGGGGSGAQPVAPAAPGAPTEPTAPTDPLAS
ncbi:MAG: type VI secretion system tip protein VgrG [Pseudomonadota bacterium]